MFYNVRKLCPTTQKNEAHNLTTNRPYLGEMYVLRLNWKFFKTRFVKSFKKKKVILEIAYSDGISQPCWPAKKSVVLDL